MFMPTYKPNRTAKSKESPTSFYYTSDSLTIVMMTEDYCIGLTNESAHFFGNFVSNTQLYAAIK